MSTIQDRDLPRPTSAPRGDRDDDGARGGDVLLKRVGPIGRLGHYMATHFRAVLVGWLAVAVVLGFFAPRVENALSGAGWQASGSQSVAAQQLIAKDFHGLSSYALMTVLHSPTMTVNEPGFRAVIAHVERALRSDAAVSTVVAPTAGLSISRDGHTAIIQAGAARDSNAMVAAANRLKGPLTALSSGGRAGSSDRRFGDVVGLQCRQSLGDAEVGGDLVAGDADDHADRVRLARRGWSSADADDDRPARHGRRCSIWARGSCRSRSGR